MPFTDHPPLPPPVLQAVSLLAAGRRGVCPCDAVAGVCCKHVATVPRHSAPTTLRYHHGSDHCIYYSHLIYPPQHRSVYAAPECCKQLHAHTYDERLWFQMRMTHHWSFITGIEPLFAANQCCVPLELPHCCTPINSYWRLFKCDVVIQGGVYEVILLLVTYSNKLPWRCATACSSLMRRAAPGCSRCVLHNASLSMNGGVHG